MVKFSVYLHRLSFVMGINCSCDVVLYNCLFFVLFYILFLFIYLFFFCVSQGSPDRVFGSLILIYTVLLLFVIVNFPGKFHDDLPKLIFQDTEMLFVEYHKRLGVSLSSNDHWDTHIENITQSASKVIGIMRRL